MSIAVINTILTTPVTLKHINAIQCFARYRMRGIDRNCKDMLHSEHTISVIENEGNNICIASNTYLSTMI